MQSTLLIDTTTSPSSSPKISWSTIDWPFPQSRHPGDAKDQPSRLPSSRPCTRIVLSACVNMRGAPREIARGGEEPLPETPNESRSAHCALLFLSRSRFGAPRVGRFQDRRACVWIAQKRVYVCTHGWDGTYSDGFRSGVSMSQIEFKLKLHLILLSQFFSILHFYLEISSFPKSFLTEICNF